MIVRPFNLPSRRSGGCKVAVGGLSKVKGPPHWPEIPKSGEV